MRSSQTLFILLITTIKPYNVMINKYLIPKVNKIEPFFTKLRIDSDKLYDVQSGSYFYNATELTYNKKGKLIFEFKTNVIEHLIPQLYTYERT